MFIFLVSLLQLGKQITFGGSGASAGTGSQTTTNDVIPSGPLEGLQRAAPTGINTERALPETIARIVTSALALIGILLVVLIVYGGFVWLTARGDEKAVEKAQGIIKDAVIGLIIVLAAYSIASFVVSRIVSATT